jgi:hypothetical protein
MPNQLIRLPFLLPEFCRTSWVSDRARATWESRLKGISSAWSAIETASVQSGVRNAAIINIRPEVLESRTAKFEQIGMVVKVLAKVKARSCYSSSIEPPRPGDAFSFRVAVGKPDAVERVARAHQQRDERTIGTDLGYPSCCSEFFCVTWVDAKLRDTTWPMSVATAGAKINDEFSVECGGAPQANILWRWMGVRAVPHLPCRFDCEQTVAFAENMLSVGRSIGFEREVEDMLTILSWPVEWSALHGIAEVKTPILKFVTRTDATAYKYRVRRNGTSYPLEGAIGLVFPYQAPLTVA